MKRRQWRAIPEIDRNRGYEDTGAGRQATPADLTQVAAEVAVDGVSTGIVACRPMPGEVGRRLCPPLAAAGRGSVSQGRSQQLVGPTSFDALVRGNQGRVSAQETAACLGAI